MGLTLKKHQQEALDFLSTRQGAGLFYEMGLGKTLIMLEHLARLQHAFRTDSTATFPFPCLIVCPLSAIGVWKRESKKFGYGFKIKALTGTFNERLNALEESADIYIVNYEGMRILNRKLIDKGFKTVIFDESHRLKSLSATQTQVALNIARTAIFRYILTGTPICKSPEDVWSQFEIIAPGHLGNYYAHRNRHIDFKTLTIRINGGSREIKKAVRFKRLPELEEKISVHALRRTKAECLDLPEKIYKQIICPMTKEQEKHYHSLKLCLATELEEKQFRVSTAAALIQKLQQVCQGFIYQNTEEKDKLTRFPSSKIEMLKDILEDIPNEKAIVFTWFKADIEFLQKELSKERRVIVYGGKAEERSLQEDEFQKTEEPVIFLANIEMAKESITLTDANHVFYYGNSWNYASRCQSEDRAHRIGQRRNVVYYDFVCPGTVDELVVENLNYKEKTADSITGDTKRCAQLILGLEDKHAA